jgi:hypothetical protein
VKGNRQNLYCIATASDFRSNHTTIRVSNNKEVDLYYGLDYEEYVEHTTIDDERDVEDKDVERVQAAHIKRISRCVRDASS